MAGFPQLAGAGPPGLAGALGPPVLATHGAFMSDDMTGTGLSRSLRDDRDAEAVELPSFPSSGARGLTLDEVELEQVVAALEASRSPATRRAYATAWRLWSEWSTERSANPMPADPLLIAAYVAGLAEAGRAMASIDRALSAISAVHLDSGYSDPTRHPGVVRVRAGLRRTVGVAPKRLSHPLTTEEIRRVVEAIPDDLRGARDRALILTGFAGALRRSEVAALTLGDVSFRSKGAVLAVRSSKTDQEGEGQLVGLARGRRPSTDPVAALHRWVALAQMRHGSDPLFGPIAWSGERSRRTPLSGRDVSRILQARAAAAGLGDLPISGHSLRAGHATEAAARGVPADRLARTTRHKSAAALARYVRPAEALSDTSSADLGL